MVASSALDPVRQEGKYVFHLHVHLNSFNYPILPQTCKSDNKLCEFDAL